MKLGTGIDARMDFMPTVGAVTESELSQFGYFVNYRICLYAAMWSQTPRITGAVIACIKIYRNISKYGRHSL